MTRDNVIMPNEYVKSTFVKEYILPRALKQGHLNLAANGFSRTLFWSPVKFFTNHFSENIETGEKVLTQVKQTHLLKPRKEKHTFIEFPHIINGKIQNGVKKILSFSVNTFNAYKVNQKNVLEQGAKLPCEDSFLGLRALDIEESKTAFCEKFIIERGLNGKKIKINPQYLPQDESEELYKALFDPEDGSISFIKNYIFKSKSEVCQTSRHETEHGWQFYLHARNTQGGATTWEQSIYDRFGDLPKSMKEEAQKYTDSIRSYVTVASDREKYRQNFIEICANKEGAKARVLYDHEKAEIQKEFPHIPQELL